MSNTARTRGKRIASVLAAATLALAMAACTSTPSVKSSGASESTAALTIAITAPVPSFDPAQLDEGAGTFVWSSVYDTLLMVDNKGAIQPNAAKSWKYSSDLKTLTLTLRSDLSYSNGQKVTASDVAATLQRTRTTPGSQQPKLDSVSSVEAPNPTTVVLTLSRPDPSLLNYLAQATGAIGYPAELKSAAKNLRPTSSGPYTLTAATVDGTSYSLKRRSDYWNAKAYPFAQVTVRVIQDPTATFNALQAGEVSAAPVQVNQKAQAQGAGLTVKEISSTATLSLLLADRGGKVQPALADVRVRQAINMAFDRNLYVKKLLGGAGAATIESFNHNGAAYDPALEKDYSFTVKKAKQLLADAGYANGFALQMPSTVISTTFEPAITQSLADIGIKVSWDPVPPQNIASSLASAKYAAVVWAEGTNSAGREMANYFSPNGYLNPFHWQTPEFEAMLQQIATEPDLNKQAALYKKANAYTVKNALNAPIASLSTFWVTAKGISVVPNVNVPKTVRMFAPGSK